MQIDSFKQIGVKKIIQFIAVVVAACLLYISAVYFFVFIPSFTRHDPTPKDNMKFFKTEENFSKNATDTIWLKEQPLEKISITSNDGLNLVAFTLPAETAVGTVVLVHGYHSEPFREYAVLARMYHNLGYNIVMPYQRTHGESEGKYITFGIKERFDILEWVKKANSMYGSDKPLFIHGISMGCATSVMTLGLDLPTNVKGVIADCGFTSPHEIIWKVLKKDMKIPTAPLILRLGGFMTERLAGFNMYEYSTTEALSVNLARDEQIPVLFIHGDADEFVPIEMSERNFTQCLASLTVDASGKTSIVANPQAEKYSFFKVKDAPHAIENLIDETGYQEKVKEFLKKAENYKFAN